MRLEGRKMILRKWISFDPGKRGHLAWSEERGVE